MWSRSTEHVLLQFFCFIYHFSDVARIREIVYDQVKFIFDVFNFIIMVNDTINKALISVFTLQMIIVLGVGPFVLMKGFSNK
jgi:hypothetical protein